ncbi:MAG: hypothetical protein ACRDBQ_13630 [Shewanella sp.]
MANPAITQKQIDFIIKATAARMTTREIANEIGTSHITVSRYQRKFGIYKTELPLKFN